eukprot:COSAG05_NODE_688_length_7906_cov_24.548098_11_plen_112_part_00
MKVRCGRQTCVPCCPWAWYQTAKLLFLGLKRAKIPKISICASPHKEKVRAAKTYAHGPVYRGLWRMGALPSVGQNRAPVSGSVKISLGSPIAACPPPTQLSLFPKQEESAL